MTCTTYMKIKGGKQAHKTQNFHIFHMLGYYIEAQNTVYLKGGSAIQQVFSVISLGCLLNENTDAVLYISELFEGKLQARINGFWHRLQKYLAVMVLASIFLKLSMELFRSLGFVQMCIRLHKTLACTYVSAWIICLCNLRLTFSSLVFDKDLPPKNVPK